MPPRQNKVDPPHQFNTGEGGSEQAQCGYRQCRTGRCLWRRCSGCQGPLVLIAAALAGAGAGLLFKSAVTQTVIAADPASRAGVLASFFVIAYFGMGVPSIAFSLVIQHLALRPSMIGFATVLSVGAIIAVTTSLRSARRG